MLKETFCLRSVQCLISFLLCLLLGSHTARSADREIRISSGIKILNAGVHKQTYECLTAENYYDSDCIISTQKVPATFGTIYGMTFFLEGSPKDAQVDLMIRIIPPHRETIEESSSLEEKRYDIKGNLEQKWQGGLDYEWPVYIVIDEVWKLTTGQWTIQVFHDGRNIGEQTFTLQEAYSSEEREHTARCTQVVQYYDLSHIEYCKEDEVAYGENHAHIITIGYGPGMDCPAGCIYQEVYAIVFKENITHPINDRAFINPSENILRLLRKKTTRWLKDDDLKQFASRRLIKQGDTYVLQYTFELPYAFGSCLVGDVYMYDSAPIQDTLDVVECHKLPPYYQAKSLVESELTRYLDISQKYPIKIRQENISKTSCQWIHAVYDLPWSEPNYYEVKLRHNGEIEVYYNLDVISRKVSQRRKLSEADLVEIALEEFKAFGVSNPLQKFTVHHKKEDGYIQSLWLIPRSIFDEAYDIKICGDGVIQIFVDGTIVHQRNFLNDKLQ